jgi:hypothetical protein
MDRNRDQRDRYGPAMHTLDKALLRRYAAEADVDPRTIEKVLAGEPVRPMPRRRAERVLRKHGHLAACDKEHASDRR